MIKNLSYNTIPRVYVVVVTLAYLIPILKEMFFYGALEWLWLLYIIPALVLAYYQGLKGALLNVFLSAFLIFTIEAYQYFVLGLQGVINSIVDIFLGTILAMTFTSFTVAILATKLQLIRQSSHTVLKNINTAILIIDAEEKVVYANEATGELTTCSASQIIGNYWSDYCPFVNTRSILIDTLRSEKNYANYERTMNVKGVQRVVLIDSFVLTNDEGKKIGALASIRDVTDKKEMEKKVQQGQSFSALGQIAAGLAHEIRNPLTSIKGYLQLMQIKNIDANQEFSKIMTDEINRINKLLTEFLILAKPAPENKELVYVENILDDVIEFMGCETTLYDIEVSKHVKASDFPVKADKEQIKQVFINVIQNAIEAMPNGGLLDIACNLEGNGTEITVRIKDTGVGINRENLNDIYNPFFTTKDEGTGLGLAVSYRIIQSHGGNLSIDSIEHVGTTVCITLPLVKE